MKMSLGKPIFLLLFVLGLFAQTLAAVGTTVADSINAAHLGNAKRYVGVYLPPNYAQNPDSTYPTVYFLHGAGGTVTPTNNFVIYDRPLFDSLISQGKIPKMIVVAVDGHSHNSFQSGWYTNSILNGNIEDYIVQDVIPYVDGKYRTKNNRQYRAVMGHSMGGYGALKLGMKHSNIFGGLASLSGMTVFDKYINDVSHDMKAGLNDSIKVGWGHGCDPAMSSAFSPNLAASDSIDHIFDNSYNIIQSVRTKWLLHDCYMMLDTYQAQLKNMLVYVNCGAVDEINFASHARLIDQKMTSLSIPHTFRIYSSFAGNLADHNSPLDRGFVAWDNRTVKNPLLLDSNTVAFGLKALSGLFTGANSGIRGGGPIATVASGEVRLQQVPGPGIGFKVGTGITGPVSLGLFDLSGRAIWKHQESRGVEAGQIIRVGEPAKPGIYFMTVGEDGKLLESRRIVRFNGAR